MKSTTTTLLLSIFFVFIYSFVLAQEKTGYVNFNLGNTTFKTNKPHSITLYGCNTIINSQNKDWRGPKNFTWNTANQVLSNLPFGHRRDKKNNRSYYVSKYYIASPPVIQLAHKTDSIDNPKTLYDIGIVTPDTFTFKGEKPVQMVYLDYAILQPMHIQYIPIKLDDSFKRLKVDLIPFKVECSDFPWIKKNGIDITQAKGASGIGEINRTTTNSGRLFLPYYFKNNTNNQIKSENFKSYLNCKVTLLNDILFHRKVFFIIDGKKHESINLKEYYKKYGAQTITLHAAYEEAVSSGCKKTE